MPPSRRQTSREPVADKNHSVQKKPFLQKGKGIGGGRKVDNERSPNREDNVNF